MPRGLLGAALLAWGLQTGRPLVGLGAGLLLELAPWVRLRFEFSPRSYATSFGLGTIALAILSWVVIRREGAWGLGATSATLGWLPLVYLPLLAQHAYGERERLDLRGFLPFGQGNRARPDPGHPAGSVDLRWPYLGLALLAAAMGQAGRAWFYPVTAALVAWALFATRPSGSPRTAWAALVLLACGLGWGLWLGLDAGYDFVLVQSQKMINRLEGSLPAILGNATQQVGGGGARGDGVVLRVWPEGGASAPVLLRTWTGGVFFRDDRWVAIMDAERLAAGPDGRSWPLAEETGDGRSLRVAAAFPGGAGRVPVPEECAGLRDLPAVNLERFRHGWLQAGGLPGFLEYRADLGGPGWPDQPPAASDLVVADEHKAVVARHLARLGIRTGDARAALRILSREFSTWTYDLDPPPPPAGVPLLDFFLDTSHRGYCEHYATAAALLLRGAGVPTRYATGWLVQERSDLEGCLVARERDAHAWTLAWVGGRWISVDLTPGGQAAAPGVLRPARDLISWLGYRFQRWRWDAGSDRLLRTLSWALLPAGLWLLWRARRVRRRVAPARRAAAPARAPGSPAEAGMRAVEERLAERGFGRLGSETHRAWAARLGTLPAARAEAAGLEDLAALWTRLRYDPGAPADLAGRCERAAAAWLAERA